MRESGRLLATVLATLSEALQPGMTTKDLAEIAKRELRSTGGQPTFLGYFGFPDVLCVSINEEVVHGIPGKRVIADGDIVSMDFGVTYNGMITDGAVTRIAGSPKSPADKRLVEITKQSLDAGIAVCKAGVRVGDIAAEIEAVLKAGKYGIIRDMVGHGVGHELHEDPNIPNYGRKGTGPVLAAGMTIAIEPMATLGDDRIYMADDGWTLISRDGSRAAHFEHTVLITKDGPEVLTKI